MEGFFSGIGVAKIKPDNVVMEAGLLFFCREVEGERALHVCRVPPPPLLYL